MNTIVTRKHARSQRGFTLAEVILATGILGVAVLALVGLMAPTLSQVEEVVETSRLVNATAKVEAFLDDYVADPERGFEDLYDRLSGGDFVPIYVWDEPVGAPTSTDSAEVLADAVNFETRVSIDFADIPDRSDIVGPILVFALNRDGTGFEDNWEPNAILMTSMTARAEIHTLKGNPPQEFSDAAYDESTFREVIPVVINR
jgi:prepilin-type N-terminal cleavage/methylation domain-containing protein